MSSASSKTEPPGVARRLAESALLAAVGVVVWFDASGYPPALAPGAPGPALFPRILALVVTGGAVLLGWQALSGAGRPRSPGEKGRRPWALVAAAGWMAAALAALPHLGTAVTLPLLVGGLAWLGGERSLRVLVGLPVAFAAAVWLLFVRLLGVPLP